MNTNNMLQTDVLDILFANRNKMYGAYQLRRNYNKRLSVAVAVMLSVCLLFAVAYSLASKKQNAVPVISTIELDLHEVHVKDKPVIVPPILKPVHVEEHIATVKLTPPVLTNDVDVPPPTVDDLANAKIDVKTTEGRHDESVVPPVEATTGAAEDLIKKENYEDIFTIVQKEAQFPGGFEAWKLFLQQNLRSDVPAENGAPAGSYTVMVSFIVNREGTISEVKAEKDPGYGMGAEAVRVIERGPGWIPALQNGRNVTYKQMQAITFVVNQE